MPRKRRPDQLGLRQTDHEGATSCRPCPPLSGLGQYLLSFLGGGETPRLSAYGSLADIVTSARHCPFFTQIPDVGRRIQVGI